MGTEAARAGIARRPWWNEPILYFVIVAAATFAWARRRRPATDSRDIHVTRAFVDATRDDLRSRLGHAPSPEDVRAEIDRFVNEEVMFREALALGLERGDVIIRRRLVQKIEFLVEDLTHAREPSDADLQAFIDGHRDAFHEPERVTFRHVFFDRARGLEPASIAARAALATLRTGAAPDAVGDPFARGLEVRGEDLARIEATFGPDFARNVSAMRVGTWSDPITTRYGVHLVRLDARTPGGPSALEAVRERAREQWREVARASANRAAIQRLRAGYRITIEGLR